MKMDGEGREYNQLSSARRRGAEAGEESSIIPERIREGGGRVECCHCVYGRRAREA